MPPGSKFLFYSSVEPGKTTYLSADVEVHSEDGRFTVLQLQSLHATPLISTTASDDVNMFSEIIWGTEEPTGKTVTWDREEYSNDYNLSFMMERETGRRRYIPQADRESLEWHHKGLFAYIDH